jgi:hypothetical protein
MQDSKLAENSKRKEAWYYSKYTLDQDIYMETSKTG